MYVCMIHPGTLGRVGSEARERTVRSFLSRFIVFDVMLEVCYVPVWRFLDEHMMMDVLFMTLNAGVMCSV